METERLPTVDHPAEIGETSVEPKTTQETDQNEQMRGINLDPVTEKLFTKNSSISRYTQRRQSSDLG